MQRIENKIINHIYFIFCPVYIESDTIHYSHSSVQALNNKLFISFLEFNDIYDPLWFLEGLCATQDRRVLHCHLITFVLVETRSRELDTWVRLSYVTLLKVHGSFDARSFLVVERCETIIDIPKVNAARARTEASTGIMMCFLKATI